MYVKTFVFSLFCSLNNNFDVYWPFRPTNEQKNQKRIWIYSQNEGIVSNITLLGPLDSWHQDLEFGPRMDIFGPVEPEIWLLEISLLFLAW